MAESLLFGFPLEETADGVRVYLASDGLIQNTNVIETYYRLDVQYQGAVKSFRLPHDLELLWTCLSPSTPTEAIMSDPAAPPESTLSEPTEASTSLPETSRDQTSD